MPKECDECDERAAIPIPLPTVRRQRLPGHQALPALQRTRPRGVWPRRSRRVIWVAIGTVLGAIGLSFAVAFVASWIGSDAEGAGYVVGMLVGMPAFLLLLPVLILAVVVDYAGRRAYPAKPIVASWDVRLDGEGHVVSLPASRISSPDHAWVDGARIPLAWTATGVSTARAALDGGTFSGTLSVGTDASEVAAVVGLGILSARTWGPHRGQTCAPLCAGGRGCDRRGHPGR